MDQQPGQQQGHRWRPGRKFYLLAVLAVALAVLLVALVVRGFLSGFPPSATRVTGPGTAEITLTAPGRYTISYERQVTGNVGGSFEMGGRPLEGIPSATLRLVSTTSGASVHLRAPSTTFTYSMANTEGQAIGEFEVDHPDKFALTSRYTSGESGPQFTLAIARGSPPDTVGYALGGLAAVVLLLIGVGRPPPLSCEWHGVKPPDELVQGTASTDGSERLQGRRYSLAPGNALSLSERSAEEPFRRRRLHTRCSVGPRNRTLTPG